MPRKSPYAIRLTAEDSDSASDMANAGNWPKGLDLAGGVVGKKIRSPTG